MKISVIMLTYNRENLIGRAIESILNQTFEDFEFIIIDNGSTDRSGAIADDYATKDSRIRVIHRERGNIGSGRNAGLDAAKGKWIAFVDDDDWCEPDYLEFLIDLAAESNADISICGAAIEGGDAVTTAGITEKIILSAEEAIIELLWRKRYNNGFPAKLFKHSMFNDMRFPDIGRYDDIHLMYKIIAGARLVASHGLQKYHVLRHDSNNSAATTKDCMITAQYLDDYRAAYRERTLWLCERFPPNSAMWWYFDWSFLISMVNKIVSTQLVNCYAHLEDMKHELNGHQEEFIDCRWSLDFEKEWMRRYVPW